ncbi:hypothetical protein F2Q69_00006283 [Brassica cretica]|uniref:Uncharacterized protein n=1 Tax=Brassica cretica TaxID=69181 RepID=A0A8S9NYJ1_BRACR|nr:hypothetical protein F2Q69_00006283 [Brassica cretica]
MSQDWKAGEYCSSELSVDCLRVSYRTWAAWALDVMIVGGPMDPGVTWRVLISLGPGEPGIKVLKGPHSAIPGEATLGTCWGIAFNRSEACHYRVPVLHAAFWRKPLSGLEGAGVDLHLLIACLSFIFGIFSFVDDTHVASDWKAGEYCSSELSVDCLRVSYRTWAAWALDVMIVGGPMDPGVTWRVLISLGPGEPGIKVLKGPHSAIPGEATLGTCWGIAFNRSEACHYRVPVLHAAFWRKPLSGLEGAGVGENPSARRCCFPRLEKHDIIRGLGSIDSTLGLAQTHSYLMSHTRFVFAWSYHLSLRVGQDQRSLGPDPSRLPL